MRFLPNIFSSSFYLEFPQGILGWLGWLLLLGLIVLLIQRWSRFNKPLVKSQRLLLFLLVLSVPLTSLFIGIQLSVGSGLPLPGKPVDPHGAVVVLFSCLPWALAAGLLGPLPGAALALLSGILQILWINHGLFLPLELMLLAVIFGFAVNQRYRTASFRMASRPLVVMITLAVLYPILYLIDTTLIAGSDLSSSLDYALTHVEGATLAMGIVLVVAGLVMEVVTRAFPARWGGRSPLIPSPSEKSLQARFLYNMAPLAFLLVVVLTAGDWLIAGNAARDMLEKRMTNAAQMVAGNIPYFLESGQNLIVQLASDKRLYSSGSAQLTNILAQDIKTVPYFTQLFLLDQDGKPIIGYPEQSYSGAQAPPEEQMGVQLAIHGTPPVQFYPISPKDRQPAAQVSFLASILDENNQVRGILIGRTDLATNPFTEPVLTGLSTLADVDGQGILLDENNQILIHPNSDEVMTTYGGRVSDKPAFFDDTAPDGTRRLVYYQPATGHSWSVIFMVPANRAQQLALGIAAPLLGMLLVLSVFAVIVLRLGLQVVTGSLKNLAVEAARISQGKLDDPLPVDGEDEVGHLRRAFEQMRASLKARLDELNRLLVVSQGVASSLEIDEAVQPILESALVTGANVARVVLAPDVVPELDGISSAPVSFGLGPAKDLYKYLDEQILAFTRQQDRLVLTNPNRPRILNFIAEKPRPEALFAIALHHENLYYGTLWVAYDRPHIFSDEEVRFLVTLASQAALAAANARLFQNAEIGRQRLAAILASTPDPVLVIDQRNQLLLANPAAWQLLNLGIESGEGQPMEQVITQKDLIDLLRSPAEGGQSAEITMPDGLVYLATTSPVLADGRPVGRVCVLRDVTHFKQLDALKSDFVSTVSHDLRSPLTLMRGYATMLEMVGPLNEQQAGYVRKIVGGVESMTRLVNNLLDLGRIEAGIGLQLEMVPIRDVVDRVISGLQMQANQKHIQLNLEVLEGTVPILEADHALMQQALHNLIENAIKYTRADGKVKVRIQTRQDRIVFEVNDNGIGISPMDQPRLFEKFYRGAQQGAKEQRGTGLGLAIVKSIAERHGGQVWVESQLGKGSTFSLAIPLRQPEHEV
jgi:signal transduction histidine kinase/HAMP domain-containing protein